MDYSNFYGEKQKRWDRYFLSICEAISQKSPCLSRQIGAVLVKSQSIISTGFNGPARDYPHCKGEEYDIPYDKNEGEIVCPRQDIGYASGTHLDECPAAHAEVNCFSNAARLGTPVNGASLYMNCIVPCKDCAVHIVNAGIIEVVVTDLEFYHEMSEKIFEYAKVKIRRFRE